MNNEYRISLPSSDKKISSGHIRLGGESPAGERLSFTNYYMERNGRPFFGICGEFHYSRYDRSLWEDEIVKMKMNGVNIVSTYIFWNHHEEIRGSWDWSGSRDLRTFVELCGKHGLYSIVRIGPFNHGEVRNGGFPDWLYGLPCEIRSNDEEYLALVRVLYAQIAEQIKGLYFKDGGPIIGTQIENEHNHSAAVWTQTSGTADQWMTTGTDGEDHLIRLKQIALECDIDTPLYTCTAWGGASTPAEEMLPLWGGYAYWPWIYYGDGIDPSTPHPPTPEYIFRDKHNNALPRSYNFEPKYTPEDYPYACCEMGGGMTQFYKYRFKFPYVSVPAMSVIKVAEGCNFLGYYMFHGGSNPKGKRDLYLNDSATPKISYDFSAMIGEFGQIRESYRRTRLLHYFFRSFEDEFCRTATTLPENAGDMSPEDTESLRYSCRSAGGRGFIFINNFQDHLQLPAREGVRITVNGPAGSLIIPEEGGFSIGEDSCCILPFRLRMGAAELRYATAQLVTRLREGGKEYCFFLIPQGMDGEFCFEASGVKEITGASAGSGSSLIVKAGSGKLFEMTDSEGEVFVICAMKDSESLDFWKTLSAGACPADYTRTLTTPPVERVYLTSGSLMDFGSSLKVESAGDEKISLRVFPDFEKPPVAGGRRLEGCRRAGPGIDSLFTEYTLTLPSKKIVPPVEYRSPDKAILSFSEDMFGGVKELLLRISYSGDIGYAYIDGDLINDNFSNGTDWEIGLMQFKERLVRDGLYLYISPDMVGAAVKSDSTMAGWSVDAKEVIARISSIEVVPVYEAEFKL